MAAVCLSWLWREGLEFLAMSASVPPVSWQGRGVSTRKLGPKAEGLPAFAFAGLEGGDV